MSGSSIKLIGSSLALVVLSVGVLVFATSSNSLVPKDISKQVTSAIFVANGKAVEVDRSTFKYDDKLKQLSYVATIGGKSLVVSEQPSPEIFADVPEYFTKWIASTGAYKNFQSTSGKVYLARNSNYGSNSVAIMNEKGTLLFAKPENAGLTDDEWKQFFLTVKPE